MATRRGPDNSMRIAVSGVYGAAHFTNVFWVQCTASSTPTQASVDAVTIGVANAWVNRMRAFVNTDILWNRVFSTYFVPGGLVLNSDQVMNTVGTDAAGSDLPPNVALGISWLAGVYWRGGKPRSYLCGLKTSRMAAINTWAGATTSAVQTAANNFLADCNALTNGAITNTKLGFVSFFTGHALRAAPLFYAFNASRVRSRIDSQRRRLGPELP